MEDINLHFTGDFGAIQLANNLLRRWIDNHIHQGNELTSDVRRITWKRVLDMNDRALRDIVVSLGGPGRYRARTASTSSWLRSDGIFLPVHVDQDLKERSARSSAVTRRTEAHLART